MKLHHACILVMLCVTGCSGPVATGLTEETSETTEETSETTEEIGGGSVQVSGKAEEYHPYCGGAYPSEEDLLAQETPWPLANRTFEVYAGERSDTVPVTSFLTDGEGRFTLWLDPGTYCVVERGSRDMTIGESDTVDRACLEEWVKGCDKRWTIDVEAGEEYDGSFGPVRPCFGPCYIGPMPP